MSQFFRYVKMALMWIVSIRLQRQTRAVSAPSVWDIQNAQHDNGTSYLVDVGLKGSVDIHGKTTIQQSLFANIVPVSIHKNALANIPSCWPATASQTQAKHNDFFCTGSEGQYTSDTEPR